MDLSLNERLDALRQISERKLTQILDSISGLKDFIIEPILIKPLEKFTGVTTLRKHGVEKIFRLEGPSIPVANNQRVFLFFSEIKIVRHVLNQVQAERQTTHGTKTLGHHMILATGSATPSVVSRLIEEEGLWGCITLHTLSWEMLKLDENLWSMELPSSLKSLMVQGDYTLLKPIARALWALQLVLGRPALILAQGTLATKIMDMTQSFQWMDEGERRRGGEGGLGCLLVVSRDIDWPTALLTPVTYTALLDQVLGVRCSQVTLPTSDDKPSSNQTELVLNSKADPIYRNIRNLHFSGVFPYLREQTKALQGEAVNSRNLSTSEMKQYVKERLQQVAGTKRALSQHIAACEAVVEQVGQSFEAIQTAEGLALHGRRGALPLAEDLLGQQQMSLSQALRLLALLSQSGLQEEASNLKTQILLCHGHQHLVTFEAMEKMHLLTAASDEGVGPVSSSIVGRVAQAVNRRASSIQAIAKRLKLFPDETALPVDPRQSARDMSYVFGGAYTPVVCRIVEWLAKGEPISQIEEALKLLPGPTAWLGRNGDPIPRPASLPVHPKTFFVFFVGGVTYAEIAAFQVLEALTGSRILIGGTSMLSRDSLVSACG